jgi:hypothetical protein
VNRKRIEEEILVYFGSARAAQGAALSEVEVFFRFPDALHALMREVGTAVSMEAAVMQRAIERGKQWEC